MWHVEQPVVAVGWTWEVHVFVDLWQSSHIIEYFAAFAVWVAGLQFIWHVEQPVETAG